jgi:hypothetical protein
MVNHISNDPSELTARLQDAKEEASRKGKRLRRELA